MNDAPTSAPSTIAARLRSLCISRRRPLTVTSHVFCCFQYMPIFANCQPGRRQKKARWGDVRGFAPRPTRGMMPLDPALAEVVDAVVKRFPAADWKERPSLTRCASGPAAESGQPGCKASGESQGIIPRKKRAFSLGFSRLSWARSLHTIVKPSAAGGGCLVFPMYSLRLRESRGRRPLVGGLGAESLQRSLCWRFLCPDYRAYTRK